MNTNRSAGQPQRNPGTLGGISWKAWLRFAVFVLLGPLALFLAAGRLDWPMAWVYAGLLIVATVISRVIVWWKNPDLLAERARSLEAENVKSWDRLLVAIVALYGPLLTVIVAGLDRRNGWSPEMSGTLQIAALGLVVLGYLLSAWAMVANKYFSAYVRIQHDREHAVVTGGPYRFVRHPGYVGGLFALLATPIMLGSLWALLLGVLTVGVMVVRTALEDRTLLEELPGYREYAARVRYRLLPGIW